MAKVSFIALTSIISCLIFSVEQESAFAAVRVKNSMRNTQSNVQRANALVSVNDINLARQMAQQENNIVNNSDDSSATECTGIYPDGNFEIGKPTVGKMAGSKETCVSIVDMYAAGAGPNGENLLVATAKLAAGDSLLCNIDSFPSDGIMVDASRVMFPADRAPTMEDVIAVMNDEQKQNAGIKIASGAVMSALGMFLLNNTDTDSDEKLGNKIKESGKDIALAAVGGAGVMALNSYTGKIAGDTILSASVNAAAGGVVGNVLSSGHGIKVSECKKDKNGAEKGYCIWGYVNKNTDINNKQAFYNISNDSTYVCDLNDCKVQTLSKISFNFENINSLSQDCKTYCIKDDKDNKYGAGTWTTGSVNKDCIAKCLQSNDLNNQKYCWVDVLGSRQIKISTGSDCIGNDRFFKVSAQIVTNRRPAFIYTTSEKVKTDNWIEVKKVLGNNPEFYDRASDNTLGRPFNEKKEDGNPDNENITIDDFDVTYVDAQDGDLMDLNDYTRTSDTLQGAAVGGVVGGISGYKNATNEVEARYLASVREYNDSLSNFVCVTGTRYLSPYNEYVVIPALSVSKEKK
ncbi:MAG: hypothetical protein ACLRFI_02000 [Alphaproteobacteria bacterium]